MLQQYMMEISFLLNQYHGIHSSMTQELLKRKRAFLLNILSTLQKKKSHPIKT